MPTPEVDFLPASYRQQSVHRKANVWRLLVGGGFAAALIVSFLYQQIMYRQTARQLDDLQPAFEQAQVLSQRLATVQADLKTANNEAELFTYLRYPWPRTQLLGAALRRLPDCVTLNEIHISHSQSAADPAASHPPNKSKDDAEAKKLEPAERDLRRLRDESASRETALVLSGVTSDTAALERYLVALGEERLFVKVEMTSLEANAEQRAGTWRFSARLGIRPGYGQPGGPESVDLKSVDRRIESTLQPVRQ